MVTVGELRDELVELGMTKEEAEGIVGKQNVLDKLEELRADKESEEIFNDVKVEEDAEEGVAGDENDGLVDHTTEPPEMSDPKWSDYVLSHLEDNEKIKGHPKADSLRRLTELLIGPIINMHTEIPQSPNIENGGRAVVIVHIEVATNHPFNLKASGSADVFPGNTETLFAKFAVATAETRAKGRALREMLRLINVVSAEELVDENEIFDPSDKITEHQIMMINQLCSTAKLDIDIEKLLAQYKMDVAHIDKISYSKARELCKAVSSYQATGVPENLIGYKENWR